VALTLRSLGRRFMAGLSWRLLAEGVIVRLRRRGSTYVEDPLMLALWAVAVVALPAYWVVIGWWVATGRGPGGRLFAFNLGGPRQRPKRVKPLC
jgi:uncharacterized membrane protein YjdF